MQFLSEKWEFAKEGAARDDLVEGALFVGDGCAISQASADIMLDMIVGRIQRHLEET